MATVQEATRRLNIVATTKGVSEAEQKLKGLSRAQEGVAVTARTQERATQSMERRLNSIQRQFDGNYRAQQAQARIMRDLNAAEAQGLVTTTRKNQLLRLAADQHRQNTVATRAHAGALALLRSVLAPLLTLFAAMSIMRAFIDNTIESEEAQAQLAAALKSTGGASGQTLQSLNAHAVALQRVTKYGDEAIGSAQSILLTFTRIGGDVFPRATEAAADLATRMKGDLNSAALQLGKALNDPIKGVTALGRAGIQFSESQKATIKSLVETNQLAKAQGIILKELETQMGGSARAARGTLGGAVAALGEAWGDLFESTGSGSDELRRSIEDVVSLLQSPSTLSAVQTFGTAFFTVLSVAAQLITAIVNGVDDLISRMLALNDKSTAALERELSSAKGLLADSTPTTVSVGPGGRIANDNPMSMQLGEDKSTELRGTVATIEAELARRKALADIMGTHNSGSGVAPTLPPLITQDQIAAAEKFEKAYAKLLGTARQRIEQSRTEAQALGMTEEAANRLRYTQDLLNKAANDNLKLKPQEIERLRALGAEMAAAEERTRSLTEAYEFGKSTFGGFFSDLRQELMNGTSLWDAFANAGANALNKIADKALGMAADGVWDMIFSALGGAIGSGVTGGSWGKGLWGSAIFNAKGNVFSGRGISAHSSTVVDRPTVFPFARGVGLMGEAGPEAIMPLRRGPDGKLGVAAANANSSGPAIVFAPVTHIDASGSNVTEAQFKALLDQRDRQWREQLPSLVKQIGANPRKGYV